MSKGVSEVIATAMLIGITVAAGGSYLAISSNLQDDVEPDTEIREFDFKVESCWEDSDRTKLLVRNQEEEAVEVTGIDLFTSEGPLNDVDYSTDTVGPSETFTTSFPTPSEKNIRLVSGETEVEHRCRNIDPEASETDDDDESDDSVSQLKEAGGPDKGVINRIEAEDSIDITEFDGNLCIGDQCENEEGGDTGHDLDIYVNESGDKMGGTLNTDKIISSNVCIGSDCDQPSSTGGEALGEDNKEADSTFALAVPEIVSNTNDGICFGENC
jgi:flagellin-like protein